MAYITDQDLIDYVGETEVVQLTDRIDAGVIDPVVVGQAVAKAAGDIDAACSKRYQVPLTAVDDFIRRIALDLARFYLYKDAATERVREAYTTARKDLDAIAAGRRSIPGAESAAVAGGVAYQAPPRVFTGDSLSDF